LRGSSPDPKVEYGVNLAAGVARGEVGVRIINIDSLARIT
jgi:hypothetical protein